MRRIVANDVHVGSIPIICSMRDKLAQFPDLRTNPGSYSDTVWSRLLDDDLDPEAPPSPDVSTALYQRCRRIPKPRVSSTRELLAALGHARARGDEIGMSHLKEELAKRSHVPNKKEGEALRRAASRGQTTLPSKKSRSRRKSYLTRV